MEYKNFMISNYNDFINKLTTICNHYNAEFKLEKNKNNAYNLYVEDLKTIAGEYMIQDIMHLVSYC